MHEYRIIKKKQKAVPGYEELKQENERLSKLLERKREGKKTNMELEDEVRKLKVELKLEKSKYLNLLEDFKSLEKDNETLKELQSKSKIAKQ